MNGEARQLLQGEGPVRWQEEDLQVLNQKFQKHAPQELLRWGVERFGADVVLGTGFGPSGIVLLHMIAQIESNVTVFYLDTDLLFRETYALRDELAERLNLQFTRVPAALELEEQSATFGADLWHHNPNACCHLRKVIPLRHFLSDKAAWITGIRRDQSPTRRHTPLLEWSQRNNVLKLNPLAFWTEEAVWNYIRTHELPHNPLHQHGYASIGCMPCTRAVEEGEHARAGRWAGQDKLECGIHVENGQVYPVSSIAVKVRQT